MNHITLDSLTHSYGLWIQVGAFVLGLINIPANSAPTEEHSGDFTKVQLNKDFTSESIYYGDFNRDGKPDIVSGPYWYEGPDFKNRHEIFKPTIYDLHQYSSTTQPCYTGDFNGDGWTDVVYVEREADGWNLVWYENPAGKDMPWKRHLALKGTWNETPVWGDVTGDGRPAFVTNHDGCVGYATYDPAKPDDLWVFHPVSSPIPYKAYKGPTHGIGLGDIEGNGRMDIITTWGWWEQPPNIKTGQPWIWHPFRFAEGAAQMFVYDVDGDGLNDVITAWNAHGYGLVWWQQMRDDQGNITWKLHEILPVHPDLNSTELRFSQLHAMDLADINGDGLKDIVTGKRFWAHGPNGDVEPGGPAVLYWFELQRDKEHGARFIPHLIDDDSGVGTQVTAVALNNHGLPDILTSNRKGTNLYLNKKSTMNTTTPPQFRTPTEKEMRGVWLLQSVETPLPGGEVQRPFGAHPTGTIIYLAGGTMAVHISGSDEAAGKLRAYSGRWQIKGGCVVHDVEESVEPDLLGVRLERKAEYDPATGTLIYKTVEAQGPGHPVVVWKKSSAK